MVGCHSMSPHYISGEFFTLKEGDSGSDLEELGCHIVGKCETDI